MGTLLLWTNRASEAPFYVDQRTRVGRYRDDKSDLNKDVR